jgi:hypothetical protein
MGNTVLKMNTRTKDRREGSAKKSSTAADANRLSGIAGNVAFGATMEHFHGDGSR